MDYNAKYNLLLNEDEEEYKLRLCNYHIIDGLTWGETVDIYNKNCGKNLSPDALRKWYSYHSNLSGSPTIDRIKIEKFKLADERTQNNAILRTLSREETLKEMIGIAVADINASFKLTPINNKTKNKDKCDKVAILQLSDFHYGAEINNPWNVYNADIARERLTKLRDETLALMEQHNLHKLYVVNLGDMICGKIHLPLRINSRLDVVTQTMQISELIAEFLADLANQKQVETIECYFTTDNHGRLDPNLKDSIDLESLSRFTPWYLQSRLSLFNNIHLNTDTKYGDDICTFKIFDYNVAAVHGHKDAPAKVVKNLSLMTKTHYDLILTAHLHHFSANEENETIVVSNGSGMGVDDFAEKLRCSSVPSQNLIICSPKNVVECIYKINLL